MKAYVAITGTLFGVLAVLHIWRTVAEWDGRAAEHWHLAVIGAIGLACAALALWALQLFFAAGRSG